MEDVGIAEKDIRSVKRKEKSKVCKDGRLRKVREGLPW